MISTKVGQRLTTTRVVVPETGESDNFPKLSQTGRAETTVSGPYEICPTGEFNRLTRVVEELDRGYPQVDRIEYGECATQNLQQPGTRY